MPQLMEMEETTVAQTGQDLLLDKENSSFNLGLVGALSGPGRDDNRAVVFGQFLIGGVDL
ncbi:MAG: hypothetical protein IMX00_09525 [Limnochordales bacterium]|nr:hypothetical protein [Limnochordales bacterium]